MKINSDNLPKKYSISILYMPLKDFHNIYINTPTKQISMLTDCPDDIKQIMEYADKYLSDKLAKKNNMETYRKNHPEVFQRLARVYYQKHKEIIKEKSRKYREENHDKYKAFTDAYNEKRKLDPNYKEKTSQQYKNNPEKMNELAMKRYWAKKNFVNEMPFYKNDIV